MKSKIIEELFDQMNKDPWYVKFKRWIKLRYWVFYSLRIRPIKKLLGFKNY